MGNGWIEKKCPIFSIEGKKREVRRSKKLQIGNIFFTIKYGKHEKNQKGITKISHPFYI
jgi:hypothetical protein